MDTALFVTAGLMGLAGIPHCAAMCSAPCAAVTLACAGGPQARPALWGWHLGRVLSYAVAGALVTASVALIAQLGSAAAFLQPTWGIVHVAAIAFGAWLVWTGRWPGWVDRAAQRLGRWSGLPSQVRPGAAPRPQSVVSLSEAARASAVGGLWAAMPCGLLQSALLVAALASGPVQGAAVMGVFAVASASGPWLGPALLLRVRGNEHSPAWATRLAGASLVVASGWSVGHGLWQQVVAWCT